MKTNIKNIIVTACFGLIVLGLMLGTLIAPAREFSRSERRRLAVMPTIRLDNLLNGNFFADSEKYLLDQMIFRDFFRGVKAFTVYNLLRQKDNNDIYIIDGHIGKIEYPLKPRSVENAAARFNEIRQRYFPAQNAWLAVIPDKNYYLAGSNGLLTLDYQEIARILDSNLADIDLIELFAVLSADDFYFTDIHWRQENLLPLADHLLQAMGHRIKASELEYDQTSLRPFKGSFYGQAAMPLQPDTLIYLSNSFTEKARVYVYENDEWTTVYNPELFGGMDPYDVYLGGARSLITIYNDQADTNRELVIFRDSFAGSLAPLLLPGYAKITLVDLRYIRTELLAEYIDFHQDQDVLFLYSTQVLNNSAMLR